MRTSGHRFAGLSLLVASLAVPVAAQEKGEAPLPPSDRAPHLILAHSGPHAPVTALAFAPNGSTLYVGGFDKQVRRYDYARDKDKWTETGSLRVPVGPSNAGVVNAIAVSPNGKWVAAAGRAPIRGESWVSSGDLFDLYDAKHLSPLLLRDVGVVYLFDATKFDPAKPDGGKVIRGLRGGVRALAFANPEPRSGPALVTAGIEWDEKANKYVGAVRVFNVNDGKELAARTDLPASTIRPGLAAWSTGPDKKLRVAVAWEKASTKDGGELLLWDIGEKGDFILDTSYNGPLSLRVGKGGAVELINAGVEWNGAQYVARLAVRSADAGPADKAKLLPLAADTGFVHLPHAIAALPLKDAGDATAILTQINPRPTGAVGRPLHLQLLDTKGKTLGRSVPLAGDPAQVPSLAASPDGRFVAVAGFADNRVEVYDANAFAAGKAAPYKLEGGKRGFSAVAFLVDEKAWLGRCAAAAVGGEHAATVFGTTKLWLGTVTDTPPKGGIVLDLNNTVRVAAPPAAAGGLLVDAPPGTTVVEIVKPGVTVTIDGQKKTIPLPPGQRVTAAAFLPGKPVWDGALGPVVAVAHLDIQSKQARVTLFDPTPATPKAIFVLSGPTLPVLSLAFSGTRPLLAAAGDDGTVVVWSLKNLTRPLATIEGLIVTARAGKVVVTTVRPDSPAAGKLDVDDEIESVADAKGVQKPVKTLLEYAFLVRSLKVGDNAQVKVKGKAAVPILVGTATGFRHPLFTLWVDPLAKNGKHDWVGWTASGPYDANTEAAEASIGWVNATGDPTQPVAFSGARQYRKLFYWQDFIRLLVETADYNEAVARRPKPRAPTVSVVFPPVTELRDGRRAIREKLDAIEVALNDPDSVLDLGRAEVRWQITGPTGASGWKRESLATNRAMLNLGKYDWKRGEHQLQVKVFESAGAPDSAALHSVAVSRWFMPPAPVLTVFLDGKAIPHNTEITTEKNEVEVTVTVDAKHNPDDAAVTVNWTGGKAVERRRNKDGKFDPVKVPVPALGTTVILVTAINLGEGVNPEAESQFVEVRVRKQALPKVTLPPTLKLLVLTEYDQRTATDEPYVVSAQKATVVASAQPDAKLTAFEWKIAEAVRRNGKWEFAEAEWQPDEEARKANTRMRELPLPVTDRAIVVQVRAKVANSEYATDTAIIRYDGLPDVSVAIPPALVTTPELNITGGLRVVGKRPFKVRVLVTSSRTGRTREFDPTPNAMLTGWESNITLFPGENQLGYVIKYDNDKKELRKAALVEVRYVRPPVVAGGVPVDVGTGSIGDVTLAVLSSPDSAPSELRVNGIRTDFRTHSKPVRFFGVGLWILQAHSVPVNAGADRLKPVPVVVWNAERESEPVTVKVNGAVEVIVLPPTIRAVYRGSVITPDRPPTVNESRFTFDLKVSSEKRFAKLELWHGIASDVGMEQMAAVKLADAVEVPGGFELTARPTLTLRPGTRNYVRVIASNESKSESFAFNVTYTPPPVRVVIDFIREEKKGGKGKPIPVPLGTEEELKVDTAKIEVEGRVICAYDDDPVALDPHLTVVFTANGVGHLPVPVPLGNTGKERKFTGRVYLNALGNLDPKAPSTTRVRAELRSGSRPVPIPQIGMREAEIRVTSTDPLREQRLHILLLGIEVPESQQKPLIQKVIHAVGGTVPGGNPNFRQGRFEHPRFSFAQLYAPRLDYTEVGDLNTLLNTARKDIENRARLSGEDWVNDVILVYYQGEDWVDSDSGRWLLHSARSIVPTQGQNPAQYAIRLDNLPQVPGLPVGLVNVASTAKLVGDLGVGLLCLRFAWEDPDSTPALLAELGKAVRAKRTVSEILATLDDGISKLQKVVAKPSPLDPTLDSAKGDVARREVGVPPKKP